MALLLAALAGCGGDAQQQVPADTAPSVAVGPVAGTSAGAVVATATGAAGGEQLYQRCVTCHQANGQGVPNAFPPLAGSEYATARDPAVPIQIVLHGMTGPVTVKGTQYNGVMPAGGTGVAMSDAEVAAVLTHVRQSWGNAASAVTPEQVAKVRATSRSASGPVTAAELKPLMAGG